MDGGTLLSQLKKIMFDSKNPLVLSKDPDKMKSLMSAFRNHEGIVSLGVAILIRFHMHLKVSRE